MKAPPQVVVVGAVLSIAEASTTLHHRLSLLFAATKPPTQPWPVGHERAGEVGARERGRRGGVPSRSISVGDCKHEASGSEPMSAASAARAEPPPATCIPAHAGPGGMGRGQPDAALLEPVRGLWDAVTLDDRCSVQPRRQPHRLYAVRKAPCPPGCCGVAVLHARVAHGHAGAVWFPGSEHGRASMLTESLWRLVCAAVVAVPQRRPHRQDHRRLDGQGGAVPARPRAHAVGGESCRGLGAGQASMIVVSWLCPFAASLRMAAQQRTTSVVRVGFGHVLRISHMASHRPQRHMTICTAPRARAPTNCLERAGVLPPYRSRHRCERVVGQPRVCLAGQHRAQDSVLQLR